MDWRDRAARNEEIHRNVNERIEDAARRHALEQRLAFHCECGESECFERIEMDASTYDEIASDPARFIVVPGHENGAIEKVLRRGDTYLVVEKLGEARRQIERDHPRGRHGGDSGTGNRR